MATEKLEIQVSADVQKAVVGVNNLNKALSQTSKELPNLNKATGQSTQTLTNFSRIVQDAPFGIIGIANNIDPLIQSFTALRATTTSTGAAFQALAGSLIGPAGIALAVSTISSLLIAYTQNQQKANAATKEAKDEFKSFADIQKDVSGSVAKEVTEVEKLVNLLQSEGISRQNKVNALKQLKSISPEYFDGLKLEGTLVNNLSDAYAEYVKNIGLTIEAKTIEKQLEQINAKLLEGKTTSEQQKVISGILAKTFQEMAKNGGNVALSQKLINQTLKQNNGLTSEDLNLNFQKNILFNRLLEIYKLIKVEQKGVTKETKSNAESTKEYEGALNGVIIAYKTQNKFLQEQADLQTLLNDLQRRNNELRGSNGAERPPTLGLTPLQQLNLAGDDSQAGAAIENIEEIKKKFLDVSDIINNGINSGIDQFFNALANNQDPFEALQQSVKRLVVELAAAVVKMLVLKALAAAFTSGGSLAGGGLLSGAGGGGGGALDLLLRGDLLSGAIGRNSTRRRNFP